MAEQQVLTRTVTYSGEGISVRTLEETISSERTIQNKHLSELGTLRSRNEELQSALATEVGKLRDLSTQLRSYRESKGIMASLRQRLAKLPWFKGRILTQRSVEELLRAQYELSARRLKEAAEFSDRLVVAKQDLYDEVERLGRKIVASAKNEETAAQRVLELKSFIDEKRLELAKLDPGSVPARELEADLDRAERQLAEASMKLKLYDTAEERIDRLKDNTRQLAETIGQLQTDIQVYVMAASEKLDLIVGQIQAIGAAADASLVVLELRNSLEALTESVNYTTRFVSETQAYLHENVDRMVDELQIFDEETEKVLAKNNAMIELDNEIQIAQAVSLALTKKPSEG